MSSRRAAGEVTSWWQGVPRERWAAVIAQRHFVVTNRKVQDALRWAAETHAAAECRHVGVKFRLTYR